MELVTTETIIRLEHEGKLKHNKKWISVDKDFDLYRYMVNTYGKGKIWSMDADELLDLVEIELKGGKSETYENT